MHKSFLPTVSGNVKSRCREGKSRLESFVLGLSAGKRGLASVRDLLEVERDRRTNTVQKKDPEREGGKA